ncbi:MAG: hypothetical protein KAH23_09460, partial [Kiritimatiellae bacterium]|nr:hypothetical protein [Kiritimatiellia bacterium]
APALVLCWRDFRHPLCRFIFILLAAVTIALSLISLRIPGSLPLHRHFIRDFIPSLAAFSHLPLFFVHRSKPVPWLSYQTLACWAVPILVLIAYSVRASRQPSQVDNFTDQKNKRLGSFAFLSICLYLFWGGMCSYVNYIGDDKIHTLNEPQNLSLDAFGYHLKLYVEPIEKSGTNPEVFNREISPPVELHTSIPVDKMIRLASMPDRGLSHEHFLTRQYLTLYPVCYSVTFHLTAVGVAGETMGTVDVSIDNGEQTLYSMDIQAQNTAVSVPMEMVFRPDRILYGAKFSCCISAPGKITIHRIDVKARLGDCFGAF